MKHKFFYSTLLLVSSFFGTASLANANTDVTVVSKDGSQNKISVAESGFIYFQNNNMVVVASTATTESSTFAIPTIQKVLFEEGSGVVNVLSAGQTVLYPTMATSEVCLANAPEGLNRIQVYNYAGALVLDEAYVAGQTISIASLPAGAYILKAGNSTFKFEKK